MDFFDFIKRFPDEKSCLDYFIAAREKAGITCKECGCTKHVRIKGPEQFECTNCKNRISIKSGTAMKNSKLSIKYWFITIYLLASTTEKISESEIQAKLGHPNKKEISKMLTEINSCIEETGNDCSFDQLLFACSIDEETINKSGKTE